MLAARPVDAIVSWRVTVNHSFNSASPPRAFITTRVEDFVAFYFAGVEHSALDITVIRRVTLAYVQVSVARDLHHINQLPADVELKLPETADPFTRGQYNRLSLPPVIFR